MQVTPGVRRTSLHASSGPDAIRVDRFHYPPGGHTHWHVHTGEQILYGESGEGWVQFDGRERDRLLAGVVVYVPIGLRHWHGAVPDQELVHLAVTAGGDTVWLGEVTEDEYLASHPHPTATPQSADDLVRSCIADLERQDLDAALDRVTDDVVYDNVPIGPVHGPDNVRAALSGALGRAEAVEWQIKHQVAGGDTVMNERVDRFLHRGRWIEIPVAGLFKIREGRIAVWRDYFDLDSYRSQTGRA
jgi:limonene-1,2-epoxide hydrolase